MILDDLHLPAGIKIAHNMPAEPSAADLDFLKALGVAYANTWIQPDQATPEYYASRKQLYNEAGFTLYGLGNSGVHNQDDIVLNLPGRDAKIEAYGRADGPFSGGEGDELADRVRHSSWIGWSSGTPEQRRHALRRQALKFLQWPVRIGDRGTFRRNGIGLQLGLERPRFHQDQIDSKR